MANSRQSLVSPARSEVPFNPGDRIVCIIFKDDAAGEVGRVDLLQDEADDYKPTGEVLGRWSRVVKHPDEEGVSAKETMASAEDFFFSLYESEAAEDDAASNALKHILALMLERKRVLRALGRRRAEGAQTYLHVKQKKNFDVPVVDISPKLMLSIQDTIGDIIL
jgi:hypothetical protein